ncbi:MAG: hypothetical protein GC192_24415 [Bacteroidetes bacterium]|nr:hypothetical protein [Bacteroidota bacterium]
MDKHSHRILSKHFAFVKHKLISFANHFDIAKHGDIKGYGREALTGEFLKTHLPDQIEFLTGEIVDTEDNRSGQVDIILQSKNNPKIPLWGNIHLSYADSVIAAIEVKSNLTTDHFKTALKASQNIKSLKRYIELNEGLNRIPIKQIPYIIFAYTGLETETILKHINDFSRENNVRLPDFAPDMIVVLDKDYYICRNDGWQFPIVPGGFFRDWKGVSDENLVGLYNYLNNLILSYNSKKRVIEIGRYFEKSIGRK